MKKLLKLSALCLTLVMMLGCLAACGGDGGSSADSADENALNLITPGKLVMGTNAAFPPFEYLEGTNVVGVDAEMLAAIAEKLGLELEISDVEFKSLPEMLSTKKIDVIAAGFTVKPEREETMDFTNTYYEAVQTIIVMKDSDIQSVDDVVGLKIGVQEGTTGLYEAEELTEEEKIVEFGNGALAVEALKNGTVDAVIIDNNPAKEYAAQSSEIRLIEDQFEPEHYAMAVNKGNKALLDAINNALRDIKADGTFDAIIAKYIK